MRRGAVRLLAGLGSVACLLALSATVSVLALTETEAGQAWLRERTQAVVDALLPREFEPVIGRQHVSFDEDGLIVVLEDVSFTQGAGQAPFLSAARIDLDLDIGDLLVGRGVVEALSVTGLSIDEAGLAAALKSGPQAEGRLAEALDGLDDAVLGLSRRLRQLGVAELRAEGGVHGPLSRLATFDASLVAEGGRYAFTGGGHALGADWRLDGSLAEAPDGAGGPILQARARVGDEPGAPLVAFDLALSRPAQTPDAVLTAALRLDAETAKGQLALERREGEAAIAVRSLAVEWPGAGLSAFGTLRTLDGNRLAFDLRGEPRLGEAAGGIIAARGEANLDARELRLDAVDYAAGEERLTAKGRVRLDGAPDIAFEAGAGKLRPATAKALWPPFAGPEARRWFMENVAEAGRIDEGRLTLASVAEAPLTPSGPLGPVGFELEARFSGGRTRTLGDLPEAEDVSGSVKAVTGRTEVAIETARLAAFPDVAVLPTTLSFVVSREPGGPFRTDANLSLELSGDVPQLARIAELEPVAVSKRAGRAFVASAGRAEVSLGASFHLEKDQPPEKVLRGYTAMLVVDGLAVEDAVGSHDLADLDGLLTLSPGLLGGDLQGRLDGLPAKIAFAQPFGPEPVGREELRVALTPDAAEMRRLVPLPADQFAGPVAAEITRKEGRLHAEVDLSRARIGLPWIGWSKGEGVPASVSFDLGEGKEGETRIEALALKGQGFGASGSALLDGQGLRSLRLADLFLNEGDEARLSLDRARNGFAVSVSGRRLDVRSALNRILHPEPGTGAPPPAKGPAFDLTLEADELRGFAGTRLRDVALNLSKAGEAIVAARLDARAENGAPVSATLSPKGGASSVSIQAGDAGAVLRFLGFYERMQGGTLAALLDGSVEGGFAGGWRLRDFALVDEPRLASLVGAPVAQDGRSIRDVMGADAPLSRAGFDLAEGNVAYAQGRLRLSDGIVRGEVFGSSFEGQIDAKAGRVDIDGSFMPAYSLNRVFGALPLVGGILGNGNEGGLIGITYRLAGSLDEPTLSVNPISLIAPGIFRRIFAY